MPGLEMLEDGRPATLAVWTDPLNANGPAVPDRLVMREEPTPERDRLTHGGSLPLRRTRKEFFGVRVAERRDAKQRQTKDDREHGAHGE
jgi:hypothetical protein